MFTTALAVDGHRMLVKNIKTTKLRRETSTKDRGELEGHPLMTIWMMNMEHQRLQTITFSSHFGLTGSNMGKGFSMVFAYAWVPSGNGSPLWWHNLNRQLVANFPTAVWGIPKACGWCSPPRFPMGNGVDPFSFLPARCLPRARSVWKLQETPWWAARGPRIAEDAAWLTLAGKGVSEISARIYDDSAKENTWRKEIEITALWFLYVL